MSRNDLQMMLGGSLNDTEVLPQSQYDCFQSPTYLCTCTCSATAHKDVFRQMNTYIAMCCVIYRLTKENHVVKPTQFHQSFLNLALSAICFNLITYFVLI